MKILTVPPQTVGSAPRRMVHRHAVVEVPEPGMPLRRLFVLVLLVLSFALSLAVLYRARLEMTSVAPGDREAPAAAADPLYP
jgi:hypothetical protein